MVDSEGALLTVVLPDYPSLQRCHLRNPSVELLQRVVSLPLLEEGCCIRRVCLVLPLSCSAVGLHRAVRACLRILAAAKTLL